MALTIKNEKAVEQFAPQQEWLITMTPIPTDKRGQEGMGGE